MTTKEIIRCFASSKPDRQFSRKELLSWIHDMGLSGNSTEALISLSLNRMLNSGELTKESWGTYTLATQDRYFYMPIPSEEIGEIYRFLKTDLPYTNYCVWNPQVIVPFMRHIPNLQMLIVEVEKIAIESAFNFLQNKGLSRRLFINPSKDDYSHYVNGIPSIIVKPLVSQAPLIDFGGVKMPTIEKIMVDIYGDVDFAYAQGSELYTIYENILSSYQINYKALYRYADRRGRRSQIEDILNTLKI